MQIAEETKLPLIFVTDDVKEDWWLRISGKTVGPLPVLRQEIHDIAQQGFQMYQVDQFMKYASEHFDAKVSNASINEATAVGSNLNLRLRALRKKLDDAKLGPDPDGQTFMPAEAAEGQVLFEKLNIVNRHISEIKREISFLRERMEDRNVVRTLL